MTATVQKLIDGPRNAVFHIVGVGATTAQVVVDVSTLSGAPSEVRVDKIKGSTNGSSGAQAQLLWDATTDVAFMAIGVNENIDIDYCDIGGLKNNAGAGKTGDVLLTSAGDTQGQYAITLYCVKKY
jgi:uncharacterized protein (UPF0261 family)